MHSRLEMIVAEHDIESGLHNLGNYFGLHSGVSVESWVAVPLDKVHSEAAIHHKVEPHDFKAPCRLGNQAANELRNLRNYHFHFKLNLLYFL